MSELIEYFNGDSLAADVWDNKYKLSSPDGTKQEKTPDEMHRRLARLFAKADSRYNDNIRRGNTKLSEYGLNRDKLTEESIYNMFKDFKYIIPQGSIMSQLGNPYSVGSLSNCFHKDTEIHTLNGVRKISEVEIGDRVVTETGEVNPVVQLHKNPLSGRRMIDLKVYKTPIIKVTENHKFLSITKEQLGWGEPVQENEVSNLRVGDYIAIPNQKDGFEEIYIDVYDLMGDSINWANKEYIIDSKDSNSVTYKTKNTPHNPINKIWTVDERFGYFIGLWYGDGCVFSLKKNKYVESTNASYREGVLGITFTFNKNETEVINFVREYGEELFGIKSTHSVVENTYQIRFNSIAIGIVFEKLFGAFCRNKKLAKFFNRCRTPIIKSLTQGLIDSDGTITKQSDVRVTLANKRLIKDFYHLLRSRNIIVGYSESKQKTNFSEEVKTARLDFTKYSEYINNSNKFYTDNRKDFKKSKYSPLFVLERDNYTLLRIQGKNVIKDYNEDYVYTIGIENVHSYSVEGLINFNCFVLGQPEDSYGGICKKDEEMVHLMKRRGGVGIDLSTLRPNDTLVKNAAKTSTGAASFMNRYSTSTREVAQAGRRGALMLSMDIRHPDIMDFITAKQDLSQVTGANISVMIRDEFMEAVEKDEEYILRFPTDTNLTKTWELGKNIELNKLYEVDGSYFKYVKAREYWEKIIECAWGQAEPGIMFIDRHWNYSPDGVYEQYKGVTTNPCSEIFMQSYDACRLIAKNLFSFVQNPFTKDAYIDFEELYKISYEQQWLGDLLVDLELGKIDKIINKIKQDPEPKSVKRTEIELWQKIRTVAANGRRTGNGFTALGDMLAGVSIKYDSKEGVALIDTVCKTMMRGELDATIDLAMLRGKFTGFDAELEKDGNDFYKFLEMNFAPQFKRMQKYGRRNVSWSTVAPTGSVSIMTQTTSGLEPLFMPFYMRRKKINPNEKDVNVDFVDQNGDSWQEYPVLHPKFKDWLVEVTQYGHNKEEAYKVLEGLDKKSLQGLFERSPWYRSTANDIDWSKRVEIQGTIQKYISHSISSTINLPNTATKEEVDKIYRESWKSGLKGVTVYRDGCRTGVLVSDSPPEKESKFNDHNAPKRPKSLSCKVMRFQNNKEKWVSFIGLMDDRPYEIFTGALESFPVPNNVEEGFIVKRKLPKGGKSYDFHYNDNGQELVIKGLSKAFNKEYWNYGKLISSMLRHGMPIYYVAQTIQDMSFGKDYINIWKYGVVRALRKFIADGTTIKSKCLNCSSENIIFEEGCSRCLDCGSSKCG